jgi:hypothetical protein
VLTKPFLMPFVPKNSHPNRSGSKTAGHPESGWAGTNSKCNKLSEHDSSASSGDEGSSSSRVCGQSGKRPLLSSFSIDHFHASAPISLHALRLCADQREADFVAFGTRIWVPHISLVFREMWDSTALAPKLFTLRQQLRATSVSRKTSEIRGTFVVRQGPCSSSSHILSLGRTWPLRAGIPRHGQSLTPTTS